MTGIALIRGSAFDTVSGEAIQSVRLFIDGALDPEMECCSKRQDVLALFPCILLPIPSAVVGPQFPFEQVQLVGQQVQPNGVYIRDKDSQVRAAVNPAYEWQSPAQQFELQSSTVRFVYTRIQHRQALRHWWQKL